MINNVKVNYNPERNDLTFGHRLEISFDLKDCNYEDLEFYWYEKADVEYNIGQQLSEKSNTPMKWADLYQTARSYSPVFTELNDDVDYDRTITCVDSPYIQHKPNNHRILEFFIVIKDKKDTVVIKATQKLVVSETNSILVQDFKYDINELADIIVPSENKDDYYDALDF